MNIRTPPAKLTQQPKRPTHEVLHCRSSFDLAPDSAETSSMAADVFLRSLSLSGWEISNVSRWRRSHLGGLFASSAAALALPVYWALRIDRP